jgi:hypothetical protein
MGIPITLSETWNATSKVVGRNMCAIRATPTSIRLERTGSRSGISARSIPALFTAHLLPTTQGISFASRRSSACRKGGPSADAYNAGCFRIGGTLRNPRVFSSCNRIDGYITKLAKIKLRREVRQSIFSGRLDIFYSPILADWAKGEFFNDYSRFPGWLDWRSHCAQRRAVETDPWNLLDSWSE